MNGQGRVGRRLRIVVGLAAVVVMGWAAETRAHFLFIRIGTQAEAGRTAEVYARVARVIDEAVTPIALALALSAAP